MKMYNVGEFRDDYKKNMYDENRNKNIKYIKVKGIYDVEDIVDTLKDPNYFGKLKSKSFPGGVAVGSSIKDIVDKPEKLYKKKIILHGFSSRYYVGLFNIGTITKVEVLDEDDNVIETYDSNEKSKANLREYFERMGYEIPEEFKR